MAAEALSLDEDAGDGDRDGDGARRDNKKKDKKSKKEKERSREKAERRRRSSERSASEAAAARKRRRRSKDRDGSRGRDSRGGSDRREDRDAQASNTASPAAAVRFKPVKVQAKLQEKDRADAAAKKMEGMFEEAKEHREAKPGRDGKEGKDGRLKEGKDAKDAKDGKDGKSKDKDRAAPLAKGVPGLGDLAAMQRRLEEERKKLRLWVIKAKQEWEERHERRGPQAPGVTNDEEYYVASPGEVFGPEKEYRADGSIGKGVFSSVFKCKSTKGGAEFAIKFVRSNNMMTRAAEKEVEIYRRMAKQAPKEDPEATPYLMFLAGKETFQHHGHLCMIFELQKCDLRSALQKYGQGRGLPLQTVAQYSRQIFLALRALRRLKVIHGDLKPDNLLMSMSKTEIKLCDFGSAMDVNETISTSYMQPRYYRAPEIMIGNQYDTQIDLWSAGVTLFELGTGKILFTGKTNNVMLMQMLEVSGQIPKRMATTGNYSAKHFSSDGDFLYRDPDSITGLPELMEMRRFAKPARPVQSFLDRVLKEPPPNADTKTQERLLPRLGDLVAKCLRLDPSERFTPEHAIGHNFHDKKHK